MQKQLKRLKEFHHAFKSFWQDTPQVVDEETRELRVTLMEEELHEVVMAMREEPLENIAKELADLLYVVYGTIGAYGLSDRMEQIFDEVHRSNMSKLGPDGQLLQREDGKVLKGPEYAPADVKSIVHTK